MSQSIEMAVRIDITVLQSIEIAVRIVLTVLQSIERDFRTDITVSQHREIALEETLQCHSQWRWLLG